MHLPQAALLQRVEDVLPDVDGEAVCEGLGGAEVALDEEVHDSCRELSFSTLACHWYTLTTTWCRKKRVPAAPCEFQIVKGLGRAPCRPSDREGDQTQSSTEL